MDLDTYIAQTTGKVVSYDGIPADAGQCVQLVADYAVKVLGVKLPNYPIAANYWEKPVPGYTKIPYPNVPLRGDIVVFSENLPGSEGAGHIDICLSGSPSGYAGFDSNWGGNKTAHQVQHTYGYVYGFLWKGENMDYTRGVMGAMKFLAVRQTGDITDAEYEKYKDDVGAYVQYLTQVQAEHHIAPQPYPPPPGNIDKASVEDYISKNLQ